jgi:hypothetical protein
LRLFIHDKIKIVKSLDKYYFVMYLMKHKDPFGGVYEQE